MKREELIDRYNKILRLKNYFPETEKSYLHHLNLFLKNIKNEKVLEANAKVLLDYFNNLKQEKKFSYSSIRFRLDVSGFVVIVCPLYNSIQLHRK